MRRLLCLFALIAATAPLPARAEGPEAIGSWVLDCAGDTGKGCILRHRERYFDKAGLSADLEVQSLRGALVPVLAVRGLPNQALLAASFAGRTEASLRFDGSAWSALSCGGAAQTYACAPDEETAAALSSALPGARSVALRLSVGLIPGMPPVTAPERTLDLSATPEALARLRAVGAIAAPRPMEPLPPGWIRLADQVMRAAGYKNGVADLSGLLRR